MARLIWTEPALEDLRGIVDYIALDKPSVAKAYAKEVFSRVERLEMFPDSGKWLEELPDGHYRELIVKPSRIIYRLDGPEVVIFHVCRGERLIDTDLLSYR